MNKIYGNEDLKVLEKRKISDKDKKYFGNFK